MQQLKIGGETYTLQIGFAAAKLLQEISRSPVLLATGKIAQGDVVLTCQAFYAGTRAHHEALTMEACEALFDRAADDGIGISGIMQAVAEELGRFLNVGGLKKQPDPHQKKVNGSIPKASSGSKQSARTATSN